ncbi:hypothetical protein [Streptomyces sp. SD15]
MLRQWTRRHGRLWRRPLIEPVTLILNALAAGAAGGVTAAVTDAYIGLKNLLLRRFRDDPDATAALNSRQEPDRLRELLQSVDDPEILRAATAVLELTDPEGSKTGKYQVTVNDSRGVTIGDKNQITQHFT